LAASRVIRSLPGWADSAYDTIVTVRRRAWGQIRRFRHAAFGCCILRLLLQQQQLFAGPLCASTW
jgi:hypothetical protein